MATLNSCQKARHQMPASSSSTFFLKTGRLRCSPRCGGERSARVEISRIELQDLGRESGQDTAEAVIKQIAEEVAGNLWRPRQAAGLEQLKDAVRAFLIEHGFFKKSLRR